MKQEVEAQGATFLATLRRDDAVDVLIANGVNSPKYTASIPLCSYQAPSAPHWAPQTWPRPCPAGVPGPRRPHRHAGLAG